jgi:hypothetical protein
VLDVLGECYLKRVDASFQEFCLHGGKQIICLLTLFLPRSIGLCLVYYPRGIDAHRPARILSPLAVQDMIVTESRSLITSAPFIFTRQTCHSSTGEPRVG